MNASLGEIKAFLRRAMELESTIYTCNTLIDQLRQLDSQVDDESRSVDEYKDGDTIPYEDLKKHPNVIYKKNEKWKTVTDSEYMRKSSTYRKYHTIEDMENGYAPPVDHVKESMKNDSLGQKISKNIFEAIGTGIGAVVMAAIPAGIVAVIYAIFYGVSYGYRDVIPDMPLAAINAFIGVELAVLVVSIAVSAFVKFFINGKSDNDGKGFNEEREFYLNKLNERNEKLARDHRALIYCASNAGRLKSASNAAKRELAELYTNSPIFPKYHYFVAVAQLLEYFDSGRCSTLDGADGAYNLYEEELSRHLIVARLENLTQKAIDARTTQYYLCMELGKTAQLTVGNKSAFDSIRNGTYIGASVIDAYLDDIDKSYEAVQAPNQGGDPNAN